MHYIPVYYEQKPVDFEKSNTQLGQNSSDQTLQTKTELEKVWK